MTVDSQRWLRLSPWLDQVLDLPPDQRDAWLDDLAGRDATLAAELQALLAGGSAGAAAQILQGAAPGVSLQALAGQRIGAYTLVEPLGEGGMGTVWLAERSDGRFEGRAAVKLLHAGIVQQALAARFRREGAILARLSHPHIARLVDAGLTDGGQPYLVLEHVAGERIDQWCDARRLGLRARVELLRPGTAGGAARTRATGRAPRPEAEQRDGRCRRRGQAARLRHRQAAGRRGRPGRGHRTDAARAGACSRRSTRRPSRRAADTVTTATDVFALGLLLYVLLTGQQPARACRRASSRRTPVNCRWPAVWSTDRTRRGEDDLLAAAAARGTTSARLAAALAGDLDNILAKALRMEPAERYATAAAFADDLRRHLEGQTVSARPDSWAYRASRFVRRHKAGVALATLALIAIVAASPAWPSISGARPNASATWRPGSARTPRRS